MARSLTRFSRHLGTVAVLAPWLAGCSVPALMTGRFESPRIALTASKVESMSLSTANASFDLRLDNDNAYSLGVRAARYRLSVNDTVVAEGDTHPSVSVPAHRSATISVPIPIPLAALQAAAPHGMMIGEIPYQLELWLSLGSVLLQREVRFVDSSDLRLNLPLGLAAVPSVPATHATVARSTDAAYANHGIQPR